QLHLRRRRGDAACPCRREGQAGRTPNACTTKNDCPAALGAAESDCLSPTNGQFCGGAPRGPESARMEALNGNVEEYSKSGACSRENPRLEDVQGRKGRSIAVARETIDVS